MATAMRLIVRSHRRNILIAIGLLLCALYLFHAIRDLGRLDNFLGAKGCTWLEGNAYHGAIAHSIWAVLLGAFAIALLRIRKDISWQSVFCGLLLLSLLHFGFSHFWGLFPASDKPYCVTERIRP